MLLKRKKVFYSFVFAVLMICGFIVTETAFGALEQRKVRVAYPLQERITDMDENGQLSGYTYDYLEEIAQYTGWSYEFVQVPGTLDEQIVTLMEMVKNGEVDLMGAAMYSRQMDDDYDFSAYGYGTAETVLQVLAEGGRTVMIDVSRGQSLRIAVLSATGRQVSDLIEYCEMNMIEPELIVCDSEQELIGALKKGEADVILGSSMSYSDELRTIARFSPRQFYFITSSRTSDGLLTELNEAMANINQTDPYFQSSLYDKYFTPENYELLLSSQEEEYVRRSGTLNVGVLNDRPPFQYRDSTGGLKGIGVDLLQYIGQKTGLEFSMTEADSQEQLYTMALNGQIDVIAGMPYDYNTAAEQKLSMTRPYVTSQYILLLNERISEENIKGKRLALPVTSTYQGYFLGNVVRYDDTDDCIRAVNSGAADYTYVDVYTAQYYINLPEFGRLKMVPQTYMQAKCCFAIPASGDRMLFNILNKAVLSIRAEEIQNIIFMNTLQKQEFSIKAFIHRNPLQAIFLVMGVFSVILFMLLIILYQRSKAGRAIALELQKHMRLYAVSNDLIFEYDYKKKELLLSIPESGDSKRSISYYDLKDGSGDQESRASCKILKDILEARESRVSEERLYSPDKQWHWFRIVVEVIHDDQNNSVYAIGRLNIIDEERQERDKLLEKAQRDSLTHLYNNESSQELIKRRLLDMQEGQAGALLILDVDYFKSINDTYGHMRGDEILREVGGRLQKCFRPDDIVGRPGGDEFIVYMTEIGGREALKERCESVCQTLRQIGLDSERCITVSLGAALSEPGQNYNELYVKADQALYKAKDAGRDGYCIL